MPSWSGIRKKLEEDYLCHALRGRIQYFVTRYRESHDRKEGRVAILLDGKELLKSDSFDFGDKYYRNWHKLWQNASSENSDISDVFFHACEGAVNDGCIDPKRFYDAFYIYDNQSIEESLSSTNALVRVFALLDRRVGKRRLLAIADKMEDERPWVQVFYFLRLEAEKIEL